ncbi:MAG: Rne/Rng family ribonuclease [Deltaproteobacteria bacterium]|nr:Rne/Rng family ribonuclease [Deltaproteobacteria bacterium]MBW2076530.1 Rne/Rng family ribonuclease [Deltaproteobacteria bacterium]
MTNELVINARPHETRVALVENGTVVELHLKRGSEQELLGNIYLGKVIRVLPGMQAAFVDIGIDKPAFLYVTDVYNDVRQWEQIMLQEGDDDNNQESATPIRMRFQRGSDINIEDLLKEGQDILVQVSKEPMGTKGARLTSHITLPGRHLVYMPTVDHIGISRRIEDEKERMRLKKIVQDLCPPGEGFIIRTVSERAPRDKFTSEMEFLTKLWRNIQKKRDTGSAPSILHKELTITLKAVRDLFTKEIDRLVIDSREEYQSVMEFIETFAPNLRYSVELYEGREPIFDAYGIEMEINRALDKKIWLKSGGYIVIESTEALTVIDVNTGSYVGKRNLEETIVKTNLEAVKEIAYQIRLRNIGGLIVIDFIDMNREADKEKVFYALKEALEKDKAKTAVLRMSELGLIEMTRKRTKEDINLFLTESCPYCEGKGRLKSPTTVCYEIFRDLERESVSGNEGKVYLLVSPEIEKVLKEEERYSVMELEKKINRRIIIVGKNDFYLEQYEISLQ